MPFPVSFGEVMAHNVPSHTREGDIALTPLLKSEVEFVVLDPLHAANVILAKDQSSRLVFTVAVEICYAQSLLGHQDAERRPLQSTASLPHTAPSLCGYAVVAMKLTAELW